MEGKSKGLNAFGVAFLYVGTIMGAGFASGREVWQFFGCFGPQAIIGVAFVGVLFVLVGLMTALLSRNLQTNDMGQIIVPGKNQKLTKLVGYFMAGILFTVLITMSAAGGAFVYQQYMIPRPIGGLLIILLVVLTVLGGFQRIRGIFRWLIPLLIVVVVITGVALLVGPVPSMGMEIKIKPSPLAPNWPLAAILYVSYNILAVIPVVATASIHAKTTRHALMGAGMGGLTLGVIALLLVLVMQKDMAFSHSMDMPILALTQRVDPILNGVYGCMLFFAIYASATTNYYAVTTKMKEGPRKKWRILFMAIAGFLIGLVGFTNVVAYMFPVIGYLGMGILLLLTIHFIQYFISGRVLGNGDKHLVSEMEVRERT